MDKAKIVAAMRGVLVEQYERARGGLGAAHEAATGDDTKSEGKYDTRALEASYLAAGQAELADELAQALQEFDATDFSAQEYDDPIRVGSLVEWEEETEVRFFLITTKAGGLSIRLDESEEVVSLACYSPLAEKLIGKTAGSAVGDGWISDVF